MGKKVFLTIFTPTYNRAKFLPRLFSSLRKQTDFDFEWLIVDDGSTDNTSDVIKSLSNINHEFNIRYFIQSNGGKHRAINRGVSESQGDWFLILDSDDWLTNDAVEIIKKQVLKVKERKEIGSITALRMTPQGDIIGTPPNYTILDSDFFSYRHCKKYYGDRAEVIKTDILKRFPFPEIENENFIGEAVVWNKVSLFYKTRFTDDAFYICEYQPGGLTDTFNKKMEENPIGAMLNQLEILNHPKCPLTKWLLINNNYWHFYNIARKKGLSIPRSVSPSNKMKFFSIFSPLISFFVKSYFSFKNKILLS